jgi:GNAT superfamily N-acetyltransferase
VSAVPALEIRPVDPHDDDDMDAFQRVYADAELAEDPEAPLYSREDAISMLTSTDSGYFCEGFGGFADGLMVGETLVSGSRRDNLDIARVWVWVDPIHGRHGIGTRLAEYAEAHVRGRGRQVAHAHARIGADRQNGNRRFAQRLGYALANVEVERRLPLPADPAMIDQLAAEAAPYHPGYEIRSVVGPVPADLTPSYVALKNLLNTEAPTGDLDIEAGQDTVDDLAGQERELVESGRTRVGAYAVDAGGAVVGFAVGAVTGPDHHHVDQWGTIVHPAHRGHRLGMAVKCAQVRTITEHFPEKTFVATTNAETNAPMVAINVALGFQITQVYGDFAKRL